jgi:hypothetical protein
VTIPTVSPFGFASFWGAHNWRDLWHEIRVINGIRSVHSGHDLGAAEGARRQVGALAGGTVTQVGRRRDVGGFIEVRVSKTRWDTYCHVIPDVQVGDELDIRSVLLRVASEADDHGTLWTGDHVHFMVAHQADAIDNRSITVDPAPYIRAGLTASGGGFAGVPAPTPIPVPILEASEMKYLSAPAGATTPPIYALIDLVAFRAQGGSKVTTVLETAKNYSRVCPTPAESVTREELNASVLAARLFVEQDVNASFGFDVPDFDPAAIAAELAPLLGDGGDAASIEEIRAELEVQAADIKAAMPTVFTAT